MKKSDLVLPEMSATIRVGSEVVFVDGSYTLSLLRKQNVLTHTSVGLSDDIWTVCAINVSVPTDISPDCLIESNNCIVKNEKGDIVFCSDINIRNIKEIGIHSPTYTLKE